MTTSQAPATSWTYRQAREADFGWLVLCDGEFVRSFDTEEAAARLADTMNTAEAESRRIAATESKRAQADGLR